MAPVAFVDILVGQYPVTLDLEVNRASISIVLEGAKPGTLVVLPEGALSGYDENPAFLLALDAHRIERLIEDLASEVQRLGLHLFFGTCLAEADCWFNAGVYLGPAGERFVYRKVNSATRERSHFAAGYALPVFDLQMGEQRVRVGIQLCRELRFPEQWQHLARLGAQLLIFMTHAMGVAEECPVWRAHLISRAAENQRFVLASNAAHVAQKCPTMVVSPDGRVLAEVCSAGSEMLRTSIDLSQTSN